MIAADRAIQRPPDAKLLVVDSAKHIGHVLRSAFVDFLRSKDLVIANDAATLPASLNGIHLRTGSPVEVRLAGRPSLKPEDVNCFTAIVFGEGDFHTRTEDRPLPPALKVGDRFALGPLSATVTQPLDHPRLVSLAFAGSGDQVWAGLSRHGRPIQYAHINEPLALWDVWTKIAGSPVAFEPPSAGFALDWHLISEIRRHGAQFATITHAAGISSTGDPELDQLLPLDEPYHIPLKTALAIRRARGEGARVVAIGTSVVRALEHAALSDGNVRAGSGLATQHIDNTSKLHVVNAILSGTHEPGTSHYQLLRAFLDDSTLCRTTVELNERGYRTHEFGDSVFIEQTQS
jgi:S-adenosylmethionine:tRNA ribosyltransferase-isomerase